MSVTAVRTVSAYVALGDSFTAGQGSADGERWADQLAARLRLDSPDLDYLNLAVDGASSAAVLEQVPAALAHEADLVTVICGANDVLLTSRPDVDGYEDRFGQILATLRAGLGPEAAIITVTAPAVWHFMELRPRTKARLTQALADLNTATKRVAGAHGVPCLEVERHPGLTDRANFSEDGLHPSAQGHDRAAEEIGRALGPLFGIAAEPKDDKGGT